MNVYYQDKDILLYNGKMQEVLDTIPENSIDSCVCDPPYELSFMNKGWDNSGVAFSKDTWSKVYRVLKPGGYLLAFGGTRTYHRICCAIEDAGFEIRDCIMWLYGSGFPKSHNVGLDIDKMNGCSDRGHRVATASRFHPDGTFEPNGEQLEPYEAKTEDGKKWSNYGTALKPAYEPIIVARKPIEDTVAKNVLKWGVGAINIDECRVGNDFIKGGTMPKMSGGDLGVCNYKTIGAERIERENTIGRFPANVITDGSDEVKVGFPDSKGACSQNNYSNGNIYRGQSLQESSTKLEGFREWYNDDGSASRYFYSAKASKKDRDEGLDYFEEKQTTLRKNTHPTVKPTELMQYLVRLVSPKGSTILDCFMGSGSTGKAVMFENRERNADYKFVGIEMTDEYLPIAVLIGHGKCYIINETSVSNSLEEIKSIVCRIASHIDKIEYIEVSQDKHLSHNQFNKIRCGDNGIFKGVPISKEQIELVKIAKDIYNEYRSDGKYILNKDKLTICQSNAKNIELHKKYPFANVNPLGEWTGGTSVDSGATNRKLGSDMGDGVTGGGLHGKDLSKADVSVNIVCFLKAQELQKEVTACCAIGDTTIRFSDGEIATYENVVRRAREYIQNIGGFEKFAEWGLIR